MKYMPYRILALVLCLAMLVGCSTAGNWQEQYDLGRRYLNEQNYEQAVLAFTEAIQIDPNRSKSYVGRGEAYLAAGETAENLAAALADYEKAGELGYQEADLWLRLADVYIRQGDFDAALETLRQGLELTGGNSEIQAKMDELESGNVADGDGRLRKRSGFDDTGALSWYHILTYDEQGRSSGVTHYDGAGTELGHVDILYDEQGRETQQYSFVGSTGSLIREERSYDESGNLVRQASYPMDGTIATVNEYTYDEAGHKVRSDTYTQDGQLMSYLLYGWEEDSEQASSLEKYSADGNLEYRVDYAFDEQGRIIRTDTTGPDGELINYIITEYDGDIVKNTGYDAEGNVLYSMES